MSETAVIGRKGFLGEVGFELRAWRQIFLKIINGILDVFEYVLDVVDFIFFGIFKIILEVLDLVYLAVTGVLKFIVMPLAFLAGLVFAWAYFFATPLRNLWERYSVKLDRNAAEQKSGEGAAPLPALVPAGVVVGGLTLSETLSRLSLESLTPMRRTIRAFEDSKLLNDIGDAVGHIFSFTYAHVAALKGVLGVGEVSTTPTAIEDSVGSMELASATVERSRATWFTSSLGLLALVVIALIPTLILEWRTGSEGLLRPANHMLAFLLLFLGLSQIVYGKAFFAAHRKASLFAQNPAYNTLFSIIAIVIGFLLLAGLYVQYAAVAGLLYGISILVGLSFGFYRKKRAYMPGIRFMGIFPWPRVLLAEGILASALSLVILYYI